MMRLVVRLSLRYRFLVLGAAIAMMAIGLVRIQSTPVDVFPEFAPPRVEIQTISIGMSTSEVESLVTVPLEQTLAGSIRTLTELLSLDRIIAEIDAVPPVALAEKLIVSPTTGLVCETVKLESSAGVTTIAFETTVDWEEASLTVRITANVPADA